MVAADGMWSPVRKHLGLATPGYRGEWHAFRQYFGRRPRGGPTLSWFEPDLLPGYAWSFPLPDGRANVGFGIQRAAKVARVQDMAAIWLELLDRPHVRAVLGDGAEPEAPHKGLAHPARIDRWRCSRSAGRCSWATPRPHRPLTGEGIGQALLTGILAAEAVVAGPGHDGVTAPTAGEARPRSWPTTVCPCC